MRRIMVLGLLGLLLAGGAGSVLAAESRWVVGEGTTLKAEAAAASADLAPLAVGSQVTVVENAGRWLKVQSGSGQQGWVFAGRLASTAPVAEVAAESGLFASAAQQSQVEVARADSARSVRGLSAETGQYAQERGTPQAFRTALDQILARKVSKEELHAFLREGRLGEYAQ